MLATYPKNSPLQLIISFDSGKTMRITANCTFFGVESPIGVYNNSKVEYRNSKQVRVTFQYSHRVSYSECTLGNHVYYSRFLDILETARGEFFRQLGKTFLQWQQQDTIFPVVECRLRYKAPARYDDLLIIETWVTSMELIRLNFAYRVFKEQLLLLEAETFHVCTGLDEKPKRLPDELCSLLKPYLPGGRKAQTPGG